MLNESEYWSVASLGRLLLEQDRKEEARAIFEGLTVTNPRHPYPWHALGIIARQSSRHEAAVDCFAHAVKLGGDANVTLDLAESLIALKRHKEVFPVLQGLLSHPDPVIQGRAALLKRNLPPSHI